MIIHERIGNIQIDITTDWTTITYWNNGSVKDEINLKSKEDVYDLEYAVKCIINEIKNEVKK